MKAIQSKFKWRAVTFLLVMLVAPTAVMWAQQKSEKFAWTTQLFLSELEAKAGRPPTAGPRRAPNLPPHGGERMLKQHRLIASPDTVGGVAYISCFIHLKDVNDLGEVRSLGVEVEETFDGLDFVTARVPVSQLEALAAIDNVTNIKVAQLMQPTTDVARQKTNVDDVLTQSAAALSLSVNAKYDGTGVVLGIIDTGIDFQHIAFKDKDGNSRIKRAYVYDGSTAKEYTTITSSAPTTDNRTEDHGTHTASTAGGSSVVVSGTNVTVTDDHASATYGGMAPGADLYLAGVNDLSDTHLMVALKKMVQYADGQGKPLVVSNSWGSQWGPHDGTGEWADLVGQYFGDNHPGRIILFASSNDAGKSKDNEGGGYFVKKSSANSESPLGTIVRSASNYDGGYRYESVIATAWSSKRLACRLYVLDSSTGAVKTSWTVTNSMSTFSGLNTYYDGYLKVGINQINGKYRLVAYSTDGIQTQSYSGGKSKYTLAIEVYPYSGSADVNMWGGDNNYFSSHLSTSGHTWTAGTDDMCVSDEATIPGVISVGAYVSKRDWTDYTNSLWTVDSYTVGDIAPFSSYATAEQSPTGQAYPWITAPGALIAAGVNHYHTASVDDNSYYGSNKYTLVVNSSHSPYGMMQGTSMSTPVAAGIVALWLQAAQTVGKRLTVGEVKNIMAQTAINDSYTTTGPSATHFGHGKIDALAGIHYILNNYSANVAVEEMSLNHTAVSMNVGETLQLEANITPANATDKSVSWKTGNEDIATVSTSGLVMALQAGTTIITSTANDGSGVSAACEVTVMPNQKYPVPYFVSVTCENEKPLRLTNDDVLKMKATFGNRGITGNVVTLPVILTNDGSLMIVEEGEELSRPFPAGQNTTVSHSLSLSSVPEGDYYATVLLYKDSDDEEEAGWNYSSDCFVNIHVAHNSLKGDIYQDGEVNGTDLVVLTNIILCISKSLPAADVNDDGEVNGTDFVVLVNIILQRNDSRQFGIFGSENTFAGTSLLLLEPFEIRAGEEKELTVNLLNPDDAITLVQFDLDLPQGLSLKMEDGGYVYDTSGRTNLQSHTLTANASDGSVRFLLASNGNSALNGTEGTVVRMVLVACDDYNGGAIALRNILLVTPDGKETKPNGMNTVGIKDVAASEWSRGAVYSVSGQQLVAPRKGVNIVGGKKVVVK